LQAPGKTPTAIQVAAGVVGVVVVVAVVVAAPTPKRRATRQTGGPAHAGPPFILAQDMRTQIRNLRRLVARLFSPLAAAEGAVAAAPSIRAGELFRRFWPYAKPYRRWLVVSFALIAAIPALETLEIWLFRWVVDDVLVPRNIEPLLPLALAYIGLNLVSAALSFADEYLSTWMGENFLLYLRTKLLSHAMRLSPDFFERRHLGDVMTRLTSDIAAIEEFMLTGLTEAISSIVRLLFFGAALFYIDWQLAFTALILGPTFFVIARRLSRRIKNAAREKRRRAGSLASVAEEALSNVSLVQATNQERAQTEKFHAQNRSVADAELAATKIRAMFMPIVDLTNLVGAILVIAAGAVALSNGRLTLGELLVFLTYLTQMYGPIRSLTQVSATVFQASAGAERVLEMLDERPRVVDRPNAHRLARGQGGIEFDNVTFCYPGTTSPALDDFSLTIEAGSTVALVGGSGAGKSTVAKLMLRFYDPDQGAMRLDGTDLRDASIESVRDNVGVLLQETLVFDATIRDNIAFARPESSLEEIVAAAKLADADEFIRALPNGYDTIVHQKGRRLSGGQRQRIAIARALLRDTPILVLDEPSAGLDAPSANRIMDPLRQLMTGRTTVVITHNLALIRDADLIAVLDRGRLVEQGRHWELMESGGVYASLFEMGTISEEQPANADDERLPAP
jgi:ATP-binding cassette subfamily B protein